MMLFHQYPHIHHIHAFMVVLSFVTLMLIISAHVSPCTEGMWAFSQDLTAILVKQEPNLLSEPSPGPATPMPTSSSATQPITLNPPPQRRHNHEKVRVETLYWSPYTGVKLSLRVRVPSWDWVSMLSASAICLHQVDHANSVFWFGCER